MSALSDVRCIVDGSTGPLVRRKLVVFRRLEPGDVRTAGSHALPHSPYLEAKLVEVGLSKSFHDDMVRVEKKRAETLTAHKSLLHSFDIPGMVLGAAGGGFVGSYLGYMPEHFRPGLGAAFGVGIVLAFVTRFLRQRAEVEALARWKALPEHKEYERIARELAEAWVRFSSLVKRELDFHTELRVGEGSNEPQRLCSIDPRGFLATPPTFDPEDWLPTEGEGVRYEEVDVMGELVTRGLEGVDDVRPEKVEADKSEVDESEVDEPDDGSDQKRPGLTTDMNITLRTSAKVQEPEEASPEEAPSETVDGEAMKDAADTTSAAKP